jgi:hypothetical protein
VGWGTAASELLPVVPFACVLCLLPKETRCQTANENMMTRSQRGCGEKIKLYILGPPTALLAAFWNNRALCVHFALVPQIVWPVPSTASLASSKHGHSNSSYPIVCPKWSKVEGQEEDLVGGCAEEEPQQYPWCPSLVCASSPQVLKVGMV